LNRKPLPISSGSNVTTTRYCVLLAVMSTQFCGIWVLILGNGRWLRLRARFNLENVGFREGHEFTRAVIGHMEFGFSPRGALAIQDYKRVQAT
jgi:hypothetical protein